MMRYLIILTYVCIIGLITTSAQTENRPLIPPLQEEPGAATWLFGQAYGNTTGAYNFGQQWYSAGQGLHFGIDFRAACGTPLVAIADGYVAFVDNFSFGSRPHNVILRHPELGLTSLYGHLLETANLVEGQFVEQGQVVGLSGDPDETCDSRPHLHFELRSADYRTALNPVPYMDANWHSLAMIGSFGSRFFQQDLDNARRWMTLDDQPDVAFGGRRLNDYANAWPPPSGIAPAPNPPLMHRMGLITADSVPVTLRRIGYDQCCRDFWWHPTLADVLYTVDGVANQRAVIYEWSAQVGAPSVNNGPAPRPHLSPDATHESFYINGVPHVRDIATGIAYRIAQAPALPAFSTDNNRLMWLQRSAVAIPGESAPNVDVVISNADGSNSRTIYSQPGADARWLDDTRLLITRYQRPIMTMLVYDTTDDSTLVLGDWYRPSRISVAPGGHWLMFFLATQPDAADNGVYAVSTRNGEIKRMDWFGAWQWRDASSVYYVPFNPDSETMQLMYHDIPTGTTRPLTDPQTQPFTIMDGVWQVSADGRIIAFHNAIDRNLWLMQIGN